MVAYPPVDIVALTSICIGGIVSIISSTQNSKCEKLRCCWGCCDCIRKPEFNKPK
tara:strand:+ start:272 stop:436 length:165 start_codon:yes stop_codon:yes gene_type:complete